MPNVKTLSRGLLIIACLLVLGACDQAKRYTDQEYLQRAKEFQAEGKLESAVIQLKNALQQNPKNAEARLRLGEIYSRMGLGYEAENELKRAKELGIDAETLKVPLGEALLLQRHYQRVMTEIQPGPASAPANIPKILELQGRAQLGLFHYAEGCKLLQDSAEKDPQYVPSYWGLARCAAARGEPDKARAELDKAIKLDDKNSGTWTMVGDLESWERHLSAAEAAYGTALKYKSNDLSALLGRAAVRIDNNKLAEASEDIDTASILARDHPTVHQLRGVVQYKQGKFAEAKTSFESALKTDPDSLPTIYWLGRTNFAQANYEQAVRQFGQYARVFPGATEVRALLALAQAKLGREQEADNTLKALGQNDIKDPQSLILLGQAHLWMGENDRAATYFGKAVEQAPQVAALRVDFATALAQKGEGGEAIEQLESAIRLDPGLVRADQLLIADLLREKQVDKAMDAVEALEKKQPNDPATFSLKALVYLSKKDFANARQSFERAFALDTSSVPAATNLAKLDLLEKKPDAARHRFEVILAKDSGNVQAMLGVAAVAATTGDEIEYVRWLEKAIQAGPSVAQPRMLLANYYLRKNDARKALALAQEAQNASPDSVEIMELLGTAQLAAGEPNNAAVTYGKLVDRFPADPVLQYKLGTAQAAGKEIDQARASLNKSLTLRPDYLLAEILLANLELEAANYGDALKLAQRIQQQYPKSHAGFAVQGNILMAQKQYALALNAYQKAFELNKDGALAISISQALRASGNPEKADARLLQWLKDHPTDIATRDYLAFTYLGAGRNPQAIEQYQLLVQADPANSRALNILAWLYQQQQDPRALATAEQGYRLAPDNSDIADTLGWILVEEGNTARGLEVLQTAAKNAPASTEIHYHLAVALAKSGDKARARIELEDLLAKNKNFPKRQQVQALLRTL